MVAVALSGPDLSVQTVPLQPLRVLDGALARADHALADACRAAVGSSAFALLLVDGLSFREEAIADAVMARIGHLPLIGGSAGDDLAFARTAVLVDGRFVSDVATVTIVSTSAPWQRFRIQHHTCADGVAVVTGADPAQRLVKTLNGRPAVAEYATLVGVREGELNPAIFSTHPLVLHAAGGEWVRSISRTEPDRSLRFFCAAEPGSILRIGQSRDPVAAVLEAFGRLEHDLGGIEGMLVFDCILRRLEFVNGGIDGQVGRMLATRNAAGFSVYGEQYDGVHVNQTMVGIAFGS
jgi:hypothetical protein